VSDIKKNQKIFDLDKALDTVDFSFNGYTPTEDALEFFVIMRLVSGEDFEFTTPLFHYWLVDLLFGNIQRHQYPYSKEVCDTITINPKRIAIIASRGVAKALPLTSVIKSPSGDITIGNSKIGDTVYDRDGNNCTIIGKSPVFDKPMYRMTMADGRVIDMSEDHDNIVWKRQKGRTIGGNRCITNSPSGWREVVLTAKELYSQGVTTSRVPTAKNPLGRDTKFQLPNVGLHAEYSANPFPIDEYTVGVILGDGSTDSTGFTRITTHVDDLYCYERNIPYVFGTHTYTKDTDGKLLNSLMFSLLQMSSKIKKYIGTENSYTKRIPIPIITGSRTQRLEVLRGLMDTEGTVTPSGSTSFTSTSVGLATDVQDIVRALGGSARIVEKSTSSPFGKAWRVYISINEDIFKLKRKSSRQQIRTDKLSVAIESITKIETVPTQCIAVSSPTKSFITNDWVVTHNSTVVTTFYPVYCAIKGKTPDGLKTEFHVMVAASQQGGGRVMAKAVQSMCEDSVFCQNHFESMRFTETESEFIRKGNTKAKNRVFLARYIGIGGGIRGIRSNIGAERPDHIIFDDVILNSDAAYSTTIMDSLRTKIKADAVNALKGGGRGKIFSVATPFHLLDPVIEMITGGAYTPVAIPICEKIYEGMPESEFVGAWPSMHPYHAVMEQYESAIASKATKEFNQERMLRISSEEDRMIQDDMIEFYSRKVLIKEIQSYNIYITTDFTTTSEARSDFSGIAAWAVNSNRDYFLIDLCLKRQGIAEQYEELFRMVNFWGSMGRPIEVGIEIDGQQKAHLHALKEEMVKRTEFFTFARQKGTKMGSQGILSKATGGNKHSRFRMMLPQFQNHKIHFPVELENTPDMKEAMLQLKYTTWEAFGGHDDFPDVVSQLGMMELIFPMVRADQATVNTDAGRALWDEAGSYSEEPSAYDSYVS